MCRGNIARIKATSVFAPPEHFLKEHYKQALPRLLPSKVWDNPKKQKIVEKLRSSD